MVVAAGGSSAPQQHIINSVRTHIPRVAFFLFGLCSFAPHVLIGLAAREWVHPKAASSAGGLVKSMAQLGSAAAGGPFGMLIDSYGWHGGLSLLCGMAALAGLTMLPVWTIEARPTHSKREGFTNTPALRKRT